MNAWQIEQQVFELEEVRIILRCPWNQDFEDYLYERKAAGNASITEWLDQRVRPLIGNIQVVVVNGSGEIPHGRTKMEKLRASYEH